MDPAYFSFSADKGNDRNPTQSTIEDARRAQSAWAFTPVKNRVLVIRRVRETLAERAREFAEASGGLRGRPLDEVLSAELLPLLDAAKFAEKNAGKLLRTRRLGCTGRPAWLGAVQTEIAREPRGVVMIVCPRNYPLMLPGIQALQALVAGNAVLLKPAPGCGKMAAALADVFREAGLPRHLLQILPEDTNVVHRALACGVDYLVLTGAAATGAAVYRACAERMIPAVMELSGSDSVIIRDDADVEMTAAALAFGLRLNAGETCIAPRRVFIARRIGERLEAHLSQLLERDEGYTAQPLLARKLEALLCAVRERGGNVIAGGKKAASIHLPLVISGGPEITELLNEELFGSVLALTFVDKDEEAVALARSSPFALGATVFTADLYAGRRLADQLNVGVVLINDMVVPTADPRIPFGGRNRSGFGITRGAEGLLSMTVPKVIACTGGKRRRHFESLEGGGAEFFAAYIQLMHGRWSQRWSALKRLVKGVRNLRPRLHPRDIPDQHEQQ